MTKTETKPLSSSKSSALTGTVKVPGDKSISHRSLIIASQAFGVSKISGILEGEDVIKTSEALINLGVKINKDEDTWLVEGRGVGGLSCSNNVLDMGNSGTGLRLMMGLVASYDFKTTFTGDESLSKRPMKRVITPLTKMGVNIDARDGSFLPITVSGSSELLPIEYELPVASAQVKSAIILAAMNTRGKTKIIEPVKTRDHTELMLKGFGAEIEVKENNKNGAEILVKGFPKLQSCDIEVPGDPSSAAFLVVAGLIVPGSEIKIKNICMNPTRTGLYDTLKEMGANIEKTNVRKVAGEDVADIIVKHSKLTGVSVPKDRVPSMIDEFPILAVAASFAEGDTYMDGLAELKVKESNRLQAVYDGLCSCGVECEMGDESLTVKGGQAKGGGIVKTNMDHRIAMSFLVMGLATTEDIKVDDSTMISTSFPNFVELMNSLGANISK